MRIIGETGNAAYTQMISGAQSSQSAQAVSNSEKTKDAMSAFDQVDISRESSVESRFQKELAARIVQDVRASGSTGTIQQLRQQVNSGAYPLDSGSIAAAMLLEA